MDNQNNNRNEEEEGVSAEEIGGCFGELFGAFVIIVIVWGIYLFIKA